MLDLGPIVLGGNVFGWTVPRADAFALLDAYLDRGGRAIDTADIYPPRGAGGDSESILGEWLAARGVRDRVILCTKVAKWSQQPGLSPANIRAAIEGSLRRLRTDHVDLYYAHEDDASVPQESYVAAFSQLVDEGKVRFLGASNFSAPRLSSALALARSSGLHAFSYSQDQYNLVERSLESSLLPLLAAEHLVELPYFSLAKGFLTGKYRPGAAVDSARSSSASSYLSNPRNLSLLTALDTIAAHHHTSVAAVALSWLRAQPPVGAPVASARTAAQLAPLFETLSLTPAELASLA